MARDVVGMQGQTTDLPPDQTGDQAFRIKNLVPASAISMKPRGGTTEVAQYQPTLQGRVILADALPEDPTGGIMLICQNNVNVGGVMSHYNEALFEFRPSRQASDFDQVRGTNLGTKIYGIFNGVPRIWDYVLNTFLDFDPASYSGETFFASTYLRRSVYEESGWDSDNGTFTYNLGLAAFLTYKTGVLLTSRLYDVRTLDASVDSHLSGGQSGSDDTNIFKSGIIPLGSPFSGFALWFDAEDAINTFPAIVVLRNATWDGDGSSKPEGIGTYRFLVVHADAVGSGLPLICDVCPMPKARYPGFVVARRQVAPGTEQLVAIQESTQSPLDGVNQLEYLTVNLREYVQADWTGWTDRPNTVLDVQQIGTNGLFPSGSLVALMGNWETPTLHKVISHPRLALLAAPTAAIPSPTGNVVATFPQPMIVVNSHANSTAYTAHGMVCDQTGYAYSCGTGDFVQGVAGYLITKFNPVNLTAGIVGVQHLSNGLGDYYADPLDTHICNPVIDGGTLLVQDIDAEKTRVFVYDFSLNYITQYVMNATPTAATQGATAANIAGGFTDWTAAQSPGSGVSGAIAPDGATDYLKITNFGFALPVGSVIGGMVAEVSRKAGVANYVVDESLKLVIAGSPAGTDKAAHQTLWGTSFESATYGKANDLWGNTLTRAIVNDSTFGIAIRAVNGALNPVSTTASIQWIKLTVYYSDGSGVNFNKYSSKFFAQVS